MLTKITHLSLFVLDQDVALAYYRLLGFAVHTDAQLGSMRWLTVCLPDQPDVEIALLKAETSIERALVGKQADRKPLFTIESTDCSQDYERLKSQGIVFLDTPTVQPWGISVMIQDIYGNTIYLCQPTRSQ